MTDEEIIAAAGEPVAHLRFWAGQYYSGHGDIEFDEWLEVTRTQEKGIDGSDAFPVFSADAILSAVKPLRERIAELEGRLNRRMEDIRLQAERYVDLETEHRDLRTQLNAALEREKDLRDALIKISCSDQTDNLLWWQVEARQAIALPRNRTK